jgi:hypothetical protein
MTTVFSVQDETGTVTQVTLMPSPSPSLIISVGDTGVYAGYPDDGTDLTNAPAFNSLPFTVVQVLDNEHFSVSTNRATMSDWPALGQITWATGMNATETSNVFEIDGANAYIDVAFFTKYHNSRGNAVPAGATTPMIQSAIVQATDYIDAKYRFVGIKLLQTVGNAVIDANATFLEAWLTPYALNGVSYLTPATSTQATQWPRQGAVDLSGDTVNGIPEAIRRACAELAIRVLNGTNLQPDYDTSVAGGGAVVSSVTKKVGPLETVTAYDTKFGLGFFASFPVVDRMLRSAGLLMASGNRTTMR